METYNLDLGVKDFLLSLRIYDPITSVNKYVIPLAQESFILGTLDLYRTYFTDFTISLISSTLEAIEFLENPAFTNNVLETFRDSLLPLSPVVKQFLEEHITK
jgi:hypothetical protein